MTDQTKTVPRFFIPDDKVEQIDVVHNFLTSELDLIVGIEKRQTARPGTTRPPQN